MRLIRSFTLKRRNTSDQYERQRANACKKERLRRLNALVNEISAKKMKEYEGQTVEVLVEGESKNNPEILAGYTSKSKLVNFKAPKEAIGNIVKVKITQAKTWSLDGEMVGEAIEVN